jgi:hypothetical protein
MKELTWGWEEIAVTLMWRLAPNGLVLFPSDLRLPHDRVLLEERLPDRISLSFVTLKEAHSRSHAERLESRASVDQLRGSRWQQIAVVMLWKLKRGGIVLTEQDRAAVPGGLELLTSGHPQGVEWRFLPKRDVLKLSMKEELKLEVPR